jgi:predicted GIY-YIG superfamily endonuclease
MGFIYKITNTVSGKCYIGETVQDAPEKRWKQHIQKINNNKGCPAPKRCD